MTLPNDDLFSRTEWVRLARKLSLPPRQVQITQEIMRGASDKQIAQRLGISVPTVRTHLGRLFARLHVDDRSELILYMVYQSREQGEQISH